jgi:PAS domain S-box-containing protein
MRILFLEDDRAFAELIHCFVEEDTTDEWEVVHVVRWADAAQQLSTGKFDMALSDLNVPDSCGLETVIRWQGAAPDLPLVVLTGEDDPATGLAAVRQGAQDFLVKGSITGPLLDKSLRYAKERAHNQTLLKENERRLGELVLHRTAQWQQEVQRRSVLFEASRDGIVLLDAGGNVVEANPRFLEMLGYSLEELSQLHYRAWAIEEDLNSLDARFERLCQTHGEDFCEVRHRRKDGSLYDAEVSAAAFLWQEETWVLCTCRDISDRKRTEAALATSEATNRAILQAIPDLLIRTDKDGNYCCLWTDDIKEARMQPGTPLAGNVREVLSPDIAERRMNYVRRALETGKLQVYEQNFDVGHYQMDEEARVVPLNDRETLVIIRDITSRRQIQAQQQRAEQLSHSLSLLNSILDVVLAGYWDWDIANHRMYLSPGFKRMFGYEDHELPNAVETWQDLMLPEDLARAWENFECHVASRGELPHFNEVRYRHRDGSLVWVACSGQVIEWDEAGHPLRMVGCHINISDRKAAELQLQRTNAELLQATRLKDEFLANMSHELRTPLNAILGMAESLQEAVYGPVSDRQVKALQTIERSGSHLLALINDILDVAKIEAGQATLSLSTVTVPALFEASIGFVRHQAAKKRIQIQTHLSSQLPCLRVDERRARQVLINLLTNAVKFTPEGGRITLTATVAPDDPQHLTLTVADTGIGIPADKIPQLFQPFIQVDSALNRQYDGTGLGLALVKRLVELHGGEVGLTSTVNEGSCFTLTLPIAADTVTAPPAEPGVAPLASPSDSPLLLLVEDNPSSVDMMWDYLEAKGYRLHLARSGQEAIASAVAQPPDMILMDIQMPEMDGFEAIRKIRQQPPLIQVPIIALTALAMEGDRDLCLAAGANDYLSKPVKLRQLSEHIQALLLEQSLVPASAATPDP